MIVRRIGPRPVLFGLACWAIAVDAALFVARTAGHAGIAASSSTTAYVVAAVLTAIVGLWLGWRRRVGTAFVAPMLAWTCFVPWAFASEFLRVGFFDAIARGFGLAIVGGFVAACSEGVLLVMFATLGRIAAAGTHHDRDGSVVIFPPGMG